jgi:hypothetical protein
LSLANVYVTSISYREEYHTEYYLRRDRGARVCLVSSKANAERFSSSLGVSEVVGEFSVDNDSRLASLGKCLICSLKGEGAAELLGSRTKCPDVCRKPN